MIVIRSGVRTWVALACAFAAVAAEAQTAPRVTLVPPAGARFLPGQRFDIRVEVDAPVATASLTLNGKPVAFTSGAPDGADGISSPGVAGFNVRGFSATKPGRYTLRAEARTGGPAGVAETTFEIVPVGRSHEGGEVKNVILFIGDGMGIAHRTAARIVRYGVTNGDPDGYLAMDRMPGTGFVSTHSLNSIVTDSAPGMSCYSTGNHQNNNQEGVWPARVLNAFYAPRVEYLGEYLHRVRGTSLGIVSTADLEDATPAANMIHTLNRGAGTGIVDQYLDESDASARGLDFARKDGKTLVLVTGDHECSGFSLIGALTGRVGLNGASVTATPDVLRALPSDVATVSPDVQPARQAAVGIYDAAAFPRYPIAADGYPASFDVPGKVLVGFGGNADRFEDWLAEPKPIIESLTPTALRTDLTARGYPASAFARQPEGSTGFFIRGQVSDRRTAVHTATDIPISAYARSDKAWRPFVGVQRNTDVFFKIAEAVLGDGD